MLTQAAQCVVMLISHLYRATEEIYEYEKHPEELHFVKLRNQWNRSIKISRGEIPRLIFSCPVPSGLPHRSHCVPMNINPCGHGTFSVGVLSFERNAPCTPFCQFILQVHFHFPDTGGSLSSISGTPFSSLQKDLKFPGSCFRPALKPDR